MSDIITPEKENRRIFNINLLTGWINILYKKGEEAVCCFAIKPGTSDLDIISPYPKEVLIQYLKIALHDLEKGRQITKADGLD